MARKLLHHGKVTVQGGDFFLFFCIFWSNQPIIDYFLWDEPKCSEKNPRRHEENMQTPHRGKMEMEVSL